MKKKKKKKKTKTRLFTQQPLHFTAMEPQESSELAANDGGSFRSFGCPFSNGNGFASSTRQTNGGGGAAAVAMNGNGIASSPSHNSAAAPDNYHIRLHVNASREIPKGGMLYGDYLQVKETTFLTLMLLPFYCTHSLTIFKIAANFFRNFFYVLNKNNFFPSYYIFADRQTAFLPGAGDSHGWQ